MDEKPTTPDPVELTRRAFAAADAGDIPAVLSFLGSDSLWDVSRWSFGTYQGPTAIGRFLGDWISSFAEYRRELVEILDVGNGVVYGVTVTHGRPLGRSDQIQLRGAAVCTWAEGVLSQITFFRDPDEARTAAEALAESRG